jgi:HTH-type transcriptional regulator/antitoxin HipB
MTNSKTIPAPPYGEIESVAKLGQLIRRHRNTQQLTLEQVSGITHLSMRFLSELERGKETASLGKTLELLHKVGLEVIIQPRGHKS